MIYKYKIIIQLSNNSLVADCHAPPPQSIVANGTWSVYQYSIIKSTTFFDFFYFFCKFLVFCAKNKTRRRVCRVFTCFNVYFRKRKSNDQLPFLLLEKLSLYMSINLILPIHAVCWSWITSQQPRLCASINWCFYKYILWIIGKSKNVWIENL